MSLRIQWLKTLSTASLVLERLSTSCWRLVCWGMFFAALWLFELPALFGNFASLLVLIFAVSGAVYFIRKDLLRFRWPSKDDVEQRIERYSDIPHRPLSTLNDNPINDTDSPLWRREQSRKNRLLSLLRAAPPRAFMANKDPRALRLGLFLALFCGLLVAGNSWKPRILSGLLPVASFQGLVAKQTPVTFWITPPEYTGLPRIIPEADTALEIPQGSILKVIIQQNAAHILKKPSLQIDEQQYAMNAAEDGAYTLEMEIPKGHRLSLHPSLFKNIAWNYNFIPDTLPSVTAQDKPQTLPDSQLQFALTLLDDYGVKTLDMRMTLDPVVENAPIGWPMEEQRSVLSPPATEFQIAPVYNLTAHPWAGLPVVFTFTAYDHLDQIAQTAPLRVILPERRFTHPVARKVIEVRKHLAWNPENHYGESAVALEGLLYLPQSYGHDIRAFLALRSAASRLYYNEPSIKTTQSVMSLLWDTALRLEDGNLSLAARDLKNIQQALEKALQNPETSDAEISELMNELRQAMAEYMQALSREWQKRMQDGQANMPQLPPEVLSQMMNMDDLAGLLDKMESEMLSGDRNAAQDMLSKLQRLMDMANPSMSMSMPPDMQMMQEGINELQELVDRQEELREQTSEQAVMFQMLEGLGVEDTRNEAPPFINTEANKTEQEALRYVLGQLMLKADTALNEIPKNMSLAEQAMRGASEQLGGNRPDLSLPFQDEAIAHLKDAQQQLAQQLAQRMAQMTGFSIGGMPSRMDPLGRPYGGQDGEDGAPFGSKVKVPSEAEKKWVQDIVNELRRRAGQRGRPREELEYYRRLLKRF